MSDLGTGLTITFPDSGFAADILDVRGPSSSREAINTSHMLTSSAHTFVPADLVDWGEVTFDVVFSNATNKTPVLHEVPENIVITYPDGSTWTFSGFMTGYDPSGTLEQRMTASVTVKVTGAVAVA